ncbi:MAG: VOC family protein [Novosphingobium sp.]|nr:VOC family protein [Novosphingobium sp.]
MRLGAMVLAGAAAAALVGGSLPANAQTPPPVPATGAVMGPALFVSDVKRSLHFYVDGLGMRLATELGPPQRHETILNFGDPGGAALILLSDGTAKTPAAIDHGHGYDRTVLQIENLAATAARLSAAGFTPTPIRSGGVSGYQVMVITDPDGYKLELVQSPPRP